MRRQRSGHIISVSSVAGLVSQPTIGLYNASKWALEGMMDALFEEVAASLGIRVTIVERGAYATEFGSPASLRVAQPLRDYDDARMKFMSSMSGGGTIGDPKSTVSQMMALVDDEKPPLRLLLGQTALQRVVHAYGGRLANWTR